MMEMDFSSLKVNPFKMYGGGNGSKICLVIQGNDYMLKFPPSATLNKDVSYTNGCFSEYVACHIFKTLGLDTQETLLGRYNDKIVVACKDFALDGFVLSDFAQLKNTIIDSSHNGYGTELSEVLTTIQEQQIYSPVLLEKHFWEMFIGDTLLGNFDRHNGNWGFLVNSQISEVKIAPIYDCGSCLYSQIDEIKMKNVLNNQKEIEDRIFSYPTSSLRQNDKRINYFQFLMSTENTECLTALKTIGIRIDLNKINSVIDDTPFISDTHKLFLKTMVKERKEQIIDRALERLLPKEATTQKDCSTMTMNEWKEAIKNEKINQSGNQGQNNIKTEKSKNMRSERD